MNRTKLKYCQETIYSDHKLIYHLRDPAMQGDVTPTPAKIQEAAKASKRTI